MMAYNPYFVEYTETVTQVEPGVYRWKCMTSKEDERKAYTMTMKICAFIAACLLVICSAFCIMQDDWWSMWIVLLCVAVFMIISLLICLGLDRMSGGVVQVYEMRDTYLKSGSGRTAAYFKYKRTRTMLICPDHIELQGPFGGPGIFARPEDLPFVRDYLLSRMPGTAIIRYRT